MSVSVCSEQSCVNQTRPTTTINLGSSQPREGGRVRASQSSSPPRKRTRRTEVPDILISGVEEAEEEWKKMADEMEETSHRAKQREKKKRAKKARVITKINFLLHEICLLGRSGGGLPSPRSALGSSSGGGPTPTSTSRSSPPWTTSAR